MLHLIQQCLADEDPAWSELWGLYKHHASQAVRRLIARAGLDASQADDIAIELFAGLHVNGCQRLLSFRGDCKEELIGWLMRLAINLTHNWIDKSWGAKMKVSLTDKRFAVPRSYTATHTEVRLLLEELEAVWSHDDVNRLRQLAGFDSDSPASTSGRTDRRQSADLEQKLREYLELGDGGKSSRGKHKGTKSSEPKYGLATQ